MLQKKIIKTISIFLFLLLSFTKVFAANYYWVGGSGTWSDINHWRTTSGGTTYPSVVPGPTDNVFFDANSGFTASSKTVTLNVTGNCHNITFAGSTVVPTFTESGIQTLNIYGSSEWQTGMSEIGISNIYYRHNGEAKTIRSNGVSVSKLNSNVYIEEESSVSLADAFIAFSFNHLAGTFNTNGNDMTIKFAFYANNGTKPRTLNLGSSNIYMTNTYTSFVTSSPNITLNAGTSHIHFTTFNKSYNSPSYGLFPYNGQTFYNVSFENSSNNGGGSLGGFHTGTVYFNKVEFKGDGGIFANNLYKELVLSPNKNYIFQSNQTQIITSLFSANTPQCVGWTTINSSTAGTQARIVAAAGATIDVSGAVIRDTNVSGGASFVANNSVNNGNNTGWTFPSYSGQNLYWVGGSGNWNDKAHWSQASGGAGGYCVPGPADNTFFDAGSGFTSSSRTVTVDNTAYTHNINFAGSAVVPTFTQSTTQTLNIYGSSEWQTGMSEIGISNIYYRHTGEAKIIKSNGVTTGNSNSNVYIEEESSVSLSDQFTTYNFNHLAGTFNTNGNNMTVNLNVYANGGTRPRTLNLGSSNIYMTDSKASFVTSSPNVTLNAGTSHIHFTTFNNNYNSISYGINPYVGQNFYNVSFENSFNSGGGSLAGNHTGTVYFNRVEFKGDGVIFGDNQYKELILASTKTYTFPANKTQTITSLFSANTPQCAGWTTINSSTVGSQARIVADAGVTIGVSGAIIKDTNVSGGASFVASNSVNDGNNTGWTFPSYSGQNLYWVGGSGKWNDKAHWSQISGGTGGYCVPGPADNTFFDAGSGFTASSKTVTVDNTVYTHNVTFAGSTIVPTFTQSGTQTLNIYGSSEWQTGMSEIAISNIYYRNTSEAKTIRSNGVTSGNFNSNIYIEEESSVSLSDAFIAYSFNHLAGTFNTNGNNMTVKFNVYANVGTRPRMLNLGSSNIYMTNTYGFFVTSSPNITLNAGTSHIHFTAFNNSYNSQNYGILPYNGQSFYNVSFENSANNGGGSLGGNHTGTVYFNRVEFKGDGAIYGNNQYIELVLSASKTYVLQANNTQTVENWILGGTPCAVTYVQSNASGTRANLNVTGSKTNFNFGNLKDINASGTSLHFGAQSTIAGQNNSNITYDAYDPGTFSGLGVDWLCYYIDNNDTSSYTINTAAFYGNSNTSYNWYKLNDSNYNPAISISTSPNLNILPFGYGTYKVEVSYTNGGAISCTVSDEINIIKKTDPPIATSNVCKKVTNTIGDISISGNNIKWYSNNLSTAELPSNTTILNGETYFASQTINNCESKRTAITVTIVNCNNVPSMINPSLPIRTY